MKRSLGIAAKLALAISLFVLPVGYTIWKLYETQQIAIDFGDKEAEGNSYLGELRASHLTLLGESLDGIGPKIEAAEAAYGPGMESAEKFDELQAALTANDAAAARAAIRALITRVGDKSNLILDPDLDSYYVMDLVLLKIPELMDQVANIAAYAEEQGAKQSASFSIAEVAGFLQIGGAFDTLVAGTEGSLAAAYDGNANNLFGQIDVLKGLLQPSADEMLAAIKPEQLQILGFHVSGRSVGHLLLVNHLTSPL